MKLDLNPYRLVPGLGTVCPFCLERIPRRRNLATCPHDGCHKELPALYMEPKTAIPHFPVQVFGWKQHGKTAYLTALTLMLMRMNNVWNRFTWAPVTEASQRMVQAVNIHEREGSMPPSTPMGVDDCYVMLLRKMEPWRDRSLLIRDCPGEAFEKFQVPLEQAPFLHRTRTLFMFISMPDLLDPEAENQRFEGRTMDMLMVGFLNTLQSHGVRLRGRRVVVVLSKADRIRNLPPGLRQYLVDDVLWAASSSPEPDRILRDFLPSGAAPTAQAFMEKYLAAMAQNEEAIRQWLGRNNHAKNFIQLAQEYRVELRFSLTSATGGQAVPGSGLTQRWEPRRVIDPFFWALDMERRATFRARLAELWSTAVAFATRTKDGLTARSNASNPRL
ncbi:MAG TPA: hypothetical protein VEW48_26065 [Thermoanaerobaculia bacterium]|nr:hypothetical protein [Thermoanaerobaculia bacterium]